MAKGLFVVQLAKLSPLLPKDILFLFCSLTSQESGEKLIPFAEEFVRFITDSKRPMLVLVGNKLDMRQPGNKQHMSTKSLKALGTRITKSMRANKANIVDKKVFVHEVSCLQDPDKVSEIVHHTIECFCMGGDKARKGGCMSG